MFLRMCMLFGLVLASCGPTHAPILEPTPVVDYQAIRPMFGDHDMFAEVYVSSNCVHTGQPLHILVDITHTGDTTYSATLDEPIFDIVLDAYSFDKQWRWSETLPAAEVPFSLTLAPSATYTIAWTWIADPFFATQHHNKPLSIDLTFREAHPSRDEIMKTDFGIAVVYIDTRNGIECPM